MCGIAAIFKQQTLPGAALLIHQMTDRMQHRGPDADGHYDDERVSLGHRRLSIIDLSELGSNPMWDVSGRYAIVYNGEVYNYKELKAELPDYPFRSETDTEVVIAGFAAWGVAVFGKLNGIFAFALYDKQEGKMYAVRDRFGIKPLYYAANDSFCMLASEQRAIIHSDMVARNISKAAISDYLFDGAVCGEQRICESIRQLPAGHYMVLEKDKPPEMAPYCFFFENVKPLKEISIGAAQKRVKELLTRAVERQLVSDVPLGAFLSGGIDSSAIVALMSEVSTERPLTFTVGFKESRFDESEYAAVVAKKFNTRHTLLTLHPDDFLHELPNALDALDTPSLDGVNTYVGVFQQHVGGITAHFGNGILR